MNQFEFDKLQKQFFNNSNNFGGSPLFVLLNKFNSIKNFYYKNIKIIYGVILSAILITLISYFIFKEPKGLFTITTNNEVYNTNQVELIDGCVFFTRNKNEEKIILCGDFKIEENK